MPDKNNILENFPKQENLQNASSESISKESIKKLEQINEKQQENSNQNTPSQNQNVIITPVIEKDKVVVNKNNALSNKIEDILEDGLGELYIQMPKEKQQEFKEQGEKTTNQIIELLKETKVKVAKILHLIMDWLLIIPGINKFFVKQEAKIKTDNILKLKK